MAAQTEHGDRPPREPESQMRVAPRRRGEKRDRATLWATLFGAAGLLSLGAGAIHAATISYQFGESTIYGVAFVAFAVGQIGWCLLIWAFPSKALGILGIVGNGAIVAIWIITRTVGAPLGPASGTPLPVSFPDSVATTLEGLVVVTGCVALALSRRPREANLRARAGIWIAAAAVGIPLAVLGVLSQAGVIPSLPGTT